MDNWLSEVAQRMFDDQFNNQYLDPLIIYFLSKEYYKHEIALPSL